MVTVDSNEEAIAHALLESKLADYASIPLIQSIRRQPGNEIKRNFHFPNS